MKKKTLTITAEDILWGEPKSYCDCPVARAVKRAFRARYGTAISVRHEGIFVGGTTDERFWIGTLPKEVERFITRFDTGKPVKPFAAVVEFR